MIDTPKPLNVVFLDRATFPDETTLKPLSFPHELTVYDRTSADEVAGRIAAADIVITNKAPLTAASISGARNLKLVAVAATGYDVVDVPACVRAGIKVSNIRNYAVNTVPEHTFALILALRRSILQYRESIRQGAWLKADQFCYFDFPIYNLAGATLGVIGDGALGKAVAEIGRAFGMRVLFAAYKGTTGMGPLYTEFDDVLRQSDVITLHSPLMPSTRNMISDREFALMDRKPLLINTARGGLVDEEALHRALSSRQIAGAGFDVVTTEPPAMDQVLVRLLEFPNFILTPHVAWASSEAVQGLVDQLIDNIELFLRGTPRNLIGEA
ncbi:MAG: D-2-hydroxyacid dehydrogenase [Mesorhizobium sp.]|nr:D-2-hydroxyacid dehydrogenase [Mesorhizobium sp.]